MHKLTKTFIEKLNITQKQAEFLTVIARNGFATVKILYILNILEDVKGIQNTYIRVKQLEKKKLIRLAKTSLPGSEYIILPTNKTIKTANESRYRVPRIPSTTQLRHNAIAIAVMLIESGLRGLVDGYITTNQINKFKDSSIWLSRKTPDGIIFNKERKKGFLIEVELHVKKSDYYATAFKNIEIEENIPAIENGWSSNFYYVDNQRKYNRLRKAFHKLKNHEKEYIRETAENTEVILLEDLLNRFNEKYNSDLKLEIFSFLI